jgi:hypothetical protein
MKFQYYFSTLTICLGFLAAGQALAHKGHEHGTKTAAPGREQTLGKKESAIQQIGESYKASIKPIFAKKCMDCHSGNTVFPWYYKIPGVKQYINSDIEEAREHLDISNDYPFKSHAKPIEDLEAIREDTEEGSMPPLIYRIAHRDSKLTDNEKKAILDWVKQSKALLQNSN